MAQSLANNGLINVSFEEGDNFLVSVFDELSVTDLQSLSDKEPNLLDTSSSSAVDKVDGVEQCVDKEALPPEASSLTNDNDPVEEGTAPNKWTRSGECRKVKSRKSVKKVTAKELNLPGTSAAAIAEANRQRIDVGQRVDKEPLPEGDPLRRPEFREIENYPLKEWTSALPTDSYVKWTSGESKPKSKKSTKEIEYQVDEVDVAWLELINKERKGLPPVSLDVLELYMDRLEKESFLQMQSNGVDQTPVDDDDALCCICSNGDCLDTDMIIFCDVCNIAVHQECYGVPHIPEGPWVCRRCLISPSREVDCILCPNKGGAFKQTEDKRWAHVSCALWIPETSFTNTTFLEPIEGVEYIPKARFRLTCFICKCKDEGACIQCHKSSCYVAFHVTCAQFAMIFMKIEAVFKGTKEIIKKIALCNIHAPNDHVNRDLDPAIVRRRLKECRKMLAAKRNCKKQTVSVPEIQPNTVVVISALAKFPEREEFMKRLVSYWKLKRIQRNGVPLLPSLQSASVKPAAPSKSNQPSEAINNAQEKKQKRKSCGNPKYMPSTTRALPSTASITLKRLKKSAISTQRNLAKLKSTVKIDKRRPENVEEPATSLSKEATENSVLNKYKQLRKHRNDMERVRMLFDLIRRRDKLKARLIVLSQDIWGLSNMPFSAFVVSIINSLIALDENRFFTQPVNVNVVTDYLQVISNPIDLGTMKKNAEKHYYDSLMELKSDFEFMIDNCLQYNTKETIYFKAALRLRKEAQFIFAEADKMCDKLEYSSEQRLNPDNMPFGSFVVNIIDSLIAMDEHGFFTQPVDVTVVTDYLQVINEPMDLGKMKESAKNDYYGSLTELKSDFDLMIDNCLTYNTEETIYFKAGLNLRKDAETIFDTADKKCAKHGFSPEQRLNPSKFRPKKTDEVNDIAV